MQIQHCSSFLEVFVLDFGLCPLSLQRLFSSGVLLPVPAELGSIETFLREQLIQIPGRFIPIIVRDGCLGRIGAWVDGRVLVVESGHSLDLLQGDVAQVAGECLDHGHGEGKLDVP